MARHKGQERQHRTVQMGDMPRLARAHDQLVLKLRTLKPAAFDLYQPLLATVAMLQMCGRAWGMDTTAWEADEPGEDANLWRAGRVTLDDIADLKRVDDELTALMRRYDSRAHRLYLPLTTSRELLVRCAVKWSGRPRIWASANA